MDGAEHQHGWGSEIRPHGEDTREPLGSRRREPSDDPLDARASRISLSRRNLEQPNRQIPHSGRRPRLDGSGFLLGPRKMSGLLQRLGFRRGAEATRVVTVPPMDGALKPNQ